MTPDNNNKRSLKDLFEEVLEGVRQLLDNEVHATATNSQRFCKLVLESLEEMWDVRRSAPLPKGTVDARTLLMNVPSYHRFKTQQLNESIISMATGSGKEGTLGIATITLTDAGLTLVLTMVGVSHHYFSSMIPGEVRT